MQIAASDYILKTGVANFRNAWDSIDPELERVDEYGLGTRDTLQEAVEAVIGILGMQTCEVRVEMLLLIAFSAFIVSRGCCIVLNPESVSGQSQGIQFLAHVCIASNI